MTIHRSRLAVLLLVAAVVLCGSQAAWAGDRAHDNGFFLRLSGGIGGASTEMDDPSGTNKIEGGTADINIAIGGVVARNFALHGTIWGWITSDPDVTFGNVSGTLPGDVDFSAFGGGVTYYFMPVNMYLSASAGVGVMSINADLGGGVTVSGESELGPAFELTLGKEWWVGTSWGLGLALAGGVEAVPYEGVDESWGGGHVALRFSATLN